MQNNNPRMQIWLNYNINYLLKLKSMLKKLMNLKLKLKKLLNPYKNGLVKHKEQEIVILKYRIKLKI